tara:strand:+ start:27 stop:230 length:204 start_codon:yes stop_codon:yes gene_type:complete
MAIVAKSFLHNSDKIVGASGDADGVLPEDIQDFVSANIGTADITTQLNITCTKFGSKVFTLVVLEAN